MNSKYFFFSIFFLLMLMGVGRMAEAQAWDAACSEQLVPCVYITTPVFIPCNTNLVPNGDFEAPTPGMTLPPVDGYYIHNLNWYCSPWQDAASSPWTVVDPNFVLHNINDPNHITTCNYFHACGGLVCNDYTNNMAYYNSLLPPGSWGSGQTNMVDAQVPGLINNRESCNTNFDDYQEAHSDDAFIGMFSCPDVDMSPAGQGNRALSEVAEAPLISPLQNHHLYYAEMYTVKHSNTNLITVPLNTFGMIFTNGGLPDQPPPEWTFANNYDNVYPQSGVQNFMPQVSNTSSADMSDNVNWQHIDGCYFGEGENFVAVGYFPLSVDLMDSIDPNNLMGDTYYYIDDVAIYEIEPAVVGDSVACCNTTIEYSIECFKPCSTLVYAVDVDGGTINGQTHYEAVGDVFNSNFIVDWNPSLQCNGSITLTITSPQQPDPLNVYTSVFDVEFCSEMLQTDLCSILLGDDYSFPSTNIHATSSSFITAFGSSIITTDELIEIQGTFLIDQSISFVNCPNIKLYPYAEIVLPSNMPSLDLSFEICTVAAICDTMWQHIYVEGNNGNPNPNFLLVSRSNILDGIHALEIVNCADYSIIDNRFNRNHVDTKIYRECSEGAAVNCCHCDYNTAPAIGELWSNDFVCTETLFSPYFGEVTDTSISLQNLLVTIGRTQFAADQNLFETKRRAGIAAKTCHVFVYNNEFRLILPVQNSPIQLTCDVVSSVGPNINCLSPRLFMGDYESDDPLATNRIINCSVGAYANANEKVEVIDNDFEIVKTGVSIELCQEPIVAPTIEIDVQDNLMNCVNFGINTLNNNLSDIDIINNEIHLNEPTLIGSFSPTGIRSAEVSNASTISATIEIGENDIFRGRFGIVAQTTFGAWVHDNEVHLLNTGILQSSPKAGISMNSCARHTVACNLVDGSTTNLNQTAHIGIQHNLSPGQIQCNITDDLSIGFRFSGAATPTFYRGNSINHHRAGIQFTASAVIGAQGSLVPGFCNGNLFNGNFDQFGVEGLPGFQPQYSQFFIPVPFTSPFVSTTSFSTPPHLFVTAGPNPTIYSCTVGFCHHGFTGDGEESMSTSLAEDVAQAELNPLILEVETEYMAQQQLYDELKLDSSLQDTTSILQAFYLIASQNDIGKLNEVEETFGAFADSSYTGDSLALEAVLNEAEAKNAEVTGNNPIDENEKMVNEIYLATIARGNTGFNSDQLDELRFIADKCPVVDGPAVYRARSILWLIEPELWWEDDLICGTALKMEEEKIKDNQPGIAPTFIFPNPVSNIAVLSIGVDHGDASLLIYNSTGEVVNSFSIPEDQNIFSFEMTNMPQGIYHYILISENTVIASGNFNFLK